MKKTGDEEKEPKTSFTRTQLYLIGGSILAIAILAFSLAHLLGREEEPPPPATVEPRAIAPEGAPQPEGAQPAAPADNAQISKLEQALPKQVQTPAPAPVIAPATPPAAPAQVAKEPAKQPVVQAPVAKPETKPVHKEKPKVKKVKEVKHKKPKAVKKKTDVKAKKPKEKKAKAAKAGKAEKAESKRAKKERTVKEPALRVKPEDDSFTTEAPQPSLVPPAPVEVPVFVPKPAPVPALPPAPAPSAPKAEEAEAEPAQTFSVVAATYAAEAEAKAKEQELVGKGYKVRVVKQTTPKTTWYKVVSGPFDNREDAEAVVEDLSGKEGLKAKIQIQKK
ncbi:MAG: SPOR domain-containing protein [Nitrospinae bacterium]|nr:SPOR domain-containing protein [Nitrospinota bacterium]